MMDPVTSVALAWLLFAGTHIGMASGPVRGPLAARLGEIGFAAVYSLVASITFALLCYVYAGASAEGPAALALGATWLRLPLMALSILGVVCVFGSLLDYPASAYAVGRAGRKPEPRGFERITRHGFAVGTSMVGLAHALLATHLTGTVFFGSFALFGVLGSIHQDRKLLARSPDVHGPYLAKTSLVPFAAILAGRNRLVLSELRPFGIVAGLLAAWGLYEAHPMIFAHGGVYVSMAAIGGAAVASLQVALRVRRHRRRREQSHGRAGEKEALYQSLAASGATLIAFVAVCHESIGHVIFPWGPGMLGGPIGWHALGLLGIALGLLLLGGTLHLIRFPVVPVALAVASTGIVLVAVTASLHGQFHMPALAVALAGVVTALCHPRSSPRGDAADGIGSGSLRHVGG